MQNLTLLINKFWERSQLPSREPIKFSRIDSLIIFLICVLISIISSYQLLESLPLTINQFISWALTFLEVILSCAVLIFISKKENPFINSRQIILIISLLLISNWANLSFENITLLAIIIPPSLIISQGMGTITALTWVAIAFISWPNLNNDTNNYLIFITFICSIIVSILGGRIRNRAQSLQIAILVPLGAFLSQSLLLTNNIQQAKDFEFTHSITSKEIFSNSLLLLFLMLGTIIMMPIFESVFGLTTKSRLLELADQEKPLLRKLSIEAPGTFEHTLLICSLAEEAARMIGADIDLIKTGALYHDIGKLHAPNWFIENQEGSINPHDTLDDPYQSAKILQNHVDQGLIYAEKYRLPKPIANFIPEHQGTLKMGYFFHKAKEKCASTSEREFRYKGPIPQTKETAILMLADGCEAALRALDINANDSEAIKTISKIISSRDDDGQLSNSNLSKAEFFLIKRAFLNVWKRIRHRRIKYPTSKNNTFS